MSTKVQISQYPKVVSSVYDLQKNAQVMSLSNSQRLAAVGCSGDVRIIRVDSPTGMTDMCSHTNPPINSFITDLSWAPVDLGKLAISYSNGSITCLNVAEKASRQSQILTEVWSSGKVSNCIHRITWHPSEPHVIGSANQDGIVRLFDLRTTPAKVSSFGQRGFAATRDIDFDPFHTHIFAEVSENGTLKVWDRRLQAKPLISKAKTHAAPILTVAWSPCWEWVLATGSKDKTVKIWDLNECGYNYQEDQNPGSDVLSHTGASLNAALNQIASTGSGTPMSTSSGNFSNKEGSGIDPVLVNTLYTPAEVSRLKWSITGGDNGSSGAAAIAPLLATIPTGAGTTAESAGNILVWDLLNQYLPLCILKGHGLDMCADFAWLNHMSTGFSALVAAPSTAPAVVSPTTATMTMSTGSRKGGRGGNGSTVNGSNKQADGRRRGHTDSTASLSNSEKSTPSDSPTKQLNPVTSLVLGILSLGRDGKILMQDLRYGYFPSHHVSSSVTAISSQGHVAFQRGYVHKVLSCICRCWRIRLELTFSTPLSPSITEIQHVNSVPLLFRHLP
jgi:WD40 repeat protein